jgi:hypothetical protein
MSSRRRRRPSGAATPSTSAPRRRTGAGAEFWGREPAEPAPPPAPIRAPEDPTALVRSLGPPPLPGWERVAEHYFAAVYEKSTNLAVALAAASGLLGPADDD